MVQLGFERAGYFIFKYSSTKVESNSTKFLCYYGFDVMNYKMQHKEIEQTFMKANTYSFINIKVNHLKVKENTFFFVHNVE